jgi:hypothetical protein
MMIVDNDYYYYYYCDDDAWIMLLRDAPSKKQELATKAQLKK